MPSSKIKPSSAVQNQLNRHHLSAKKKYGQNFLIRNDILKRIVDVAEITKKDAVIEIGPGLGALTRYLCEASGFVLAYEIDERLRPLLEENLKEFANYQIIWDDVLKRDLAKDIELYIPKGTSVYVVANLPYYITTPILFKFLEEAPQILRYVMMMQYEVAQRICGVPQTKDYNALSVAIAYRATASNVFCVPKTAFVPMPQVDSAVVRLDVDSIPKIKAVDEDFFFRLIRLCFRQRRKTLWNNLSFSFPKDLLKQCFFELNLPLSVRAEELNVYELVQLADWFTNSGK